MSEPVNVHDYEQAARAALDPDIFDCFACGAGDENACDHFCDHPLAVSSS